MNKVILMGRLTKDPEVKQTPSNIAVCSFTIACDRRFKSQNGERQSDFINCVAWRQQATLLGNYFHKGSRIAVVGSLQSRSYDDQNGQKRYVTEVVVDEIEFVDTRSEAQGQGAPAPASAAPAQSAPTASVVAQTPPPAQQIDPGFEASMDSDDSSQLPFDVMGY
ncbi:MAG TPA: single-stranded DNA-binding protein [Clostridiales bacterium]|nr:single-stranded DNA-binding protein [Saccharofermentanaceae bacterium]HAU50992.1 single-stranded DNA-binding protein [Clostridiales bacterium]HBY32398.1 single-stranded DNA-binding protein [Clostridiales bacterium]